MFHRIVLKPPPPPPTPTILSMEAIIALSNDRRDMAKLNPRYDWQDLYRGPRLCYILNV